MKEGERNGLLTNGDGMRGLLEKANFQMSVHYT